MEYLPQSQLVARGRPWLERAPARWGWEWDVTTRIRIILIICIIEIVPTPEALAFESLMEH